MARKNTSRSKAAAQKKREKLTGDKRYKDIITTKNMSSGSKMKSIDQLNRNLSRKPKKPKK